MRSGDAAKAEHIDQVGVSGVVVATEPTEEHQMVVDDLLGLSAAERTAADFSNLIELLPDVRGQGVEALLKLGRGHDPTSSKRSAGPCTAGWYRRRHP